MMPTHLHCETDRQRHCIYDERYKELNLSQSHDWMKMCRHHVLVVRSKILKHLYTISQ